VCSSDLTVDATTNVGYNNNLCLKQIIIHPQDKIEALQNQLAPLVVVGNNTVREVQILWTEVPQAVEYTVYLCKTGGLNFQCRHNSPVDWLTVAPGNTTQAYLSLEGRYEEYTFAVSVEKPSACELASSGMVFYNHCIYDADKEVTLPNHFQAAPTNDQTAGSLTVQWQNPACSQSGYIHHYLITYCQMSLCEQDIFEGNFTVKNSLAGKQTFTIPHLDPGMKYKVFIQSHAPYVSTNFSATDYHAVLWLNTEVNQMVPVLLCAFLAGLCIAGCCHRRWINYRKSLTIILPKGNASHLHLMETF
jgi:hypothetical protein